MPVRDNVGGPDLPPDHVERATGGQQHEAGRAAGRDAVLVAEAQHGGCPVGHHREALGDLAGCGELGGMRPDEGDLHGVPGAERVPGIHDVVVAERHVDARREGFLDARQPPALRVVVEAALQVQVDQRVADQVDAGPGQDPLEFQGVGGVIRAHRRGVACRRPPTQPAARRQRREHLGEPRLLIVDLVTVRVQHQPVPDGDVDGDLQRPDPVLPGVLEVRDGADHVDAPDRRLLD